MKCSMTGTEIHDTSDGIWDDGEWISWGYIDSQLEGYDDEKKPLSECSCDELLEIAEDYEMGLENAELMSEGYEGSLEDAELEGEVRRFPIYGEIGELYVERRFGLIRHAPHTQGSDGKIGNYLVEVKTMAPFRSSRKVRVKRAGDFDVLAIVKITTDFRLDAKLIKRSRLPKGDGKYIKISWDDYLSDHQAIREELEV